MRHDLPAWCGMLAENTRVRDSALTTNGVLLDEHAQALWDAGLHRLTVSLDTLRPDRFRAMTRRDDHARCSPASQAARPPALRALKIDAVVVRGVNDDELVDLIEFGRSRRRSALHRIHGRRRRDAVVAPSSVVSRAAMLQRLSPAATEAIAPVAKRARPRPNASAFRTAPSSASSPPPPTPFCRRCDRSRLTADGIWYLCLYAENGTDLRKSLRSGATREEIKSLIVSQWAKRNRSRRRRTQGSAVARGVGRNPTAPEGPPLGNAHAGRLGATLLQQKRFTRRACGLALGSSPLGNARWQQARKAVICCGLALAGLPFYVLPENLSRTNSAPWQGQKLLVSNLDSSFALIL